MSMGIYTIGYLFLITGVTYLAYLMQLPAAYILTGVLIMTGVAIATGLQTSRRSRI